MFMGYEHQKVAFPTPSNTVKTLIAKWQQSLLRHILYADFCQCYLER